LKTGKKGGIYLVVICSYLKNWQKQANINAYLFGGD
jgi:hypothetical protein